MAKYSNKNYDELDITKAELKQFEEALKKEEFRKMFCDYVEEVTDPKNKAIYEKEMIQLEKERGVDLTFMHPIPGYVIKTSVDGEQKAFINICSNDKIDKPVSAKNVKNGVSGNDWSIPYLLAPPKVDLDKKGQRCVVYDVLFHPLALQIAKANKEFRNLLNDTAISGVEDSFNAKLDRNNIKFPKMDFKGTKIASVVRKLRKDTSHNTGEEPLNIPNYPYKVPNEDKKPTVTKPRKCCYGANQNQVYTSPKYIIKQRKGVDFCEFLDTPDSKMNAAIPSELVVEVELPLLSSVGDAVLDVSTRRLTLESKSPAKYMLDIKLPYDVDESNGSAKFDKRTKKLIVNLPVIKRSIDLSYLSRDDSGIESDQNQNRSSSDEDLSKPMIEVLSSCDKTIESENSNNCLRTSAQLSGEFLSSDLHYTFPSSVVFNNANSISITINVKNIDPTTVSHQYVLHGSGVHFKFTSLGSGHFPIHYAYCIHFSDFFISPSSLKVDVWDNNLVICMDLESDGGIFVNSYQVGLNPESLEKRDFSPINTTIQDNNLNKIGNKVDEENVKKKVNHEEVVTTQRATHHSKDLPSERRKVLKNENIQKEDVEQNEDLCKKLSSVEISSHSCQINKKQVKVRTASESNAHPPCLAAFSRRSILKTSRSLSESNTDEYNTWSSLDSSDANDEANGIVVKKTVRFSDVISKKVFRANSSILGQKHKNEKKSRNRKKMARRRIESDTSEISDFSDYSEVSEASASETSEASDASSDDQSSGGSHPPPQLASGKRHRRRGSKNSRKNAATAKQNSFLLAHD